jgi:hypothetical protein
MSRREALFTLLAIGFASATTSALAQTGRKSSPHRFHHAAFGAHEYDAAFRDALPNLGYVEGRTIRIDYRWAAGNEKEPMSSSPTARAERRNHRRGDRTGHPRRGCARRRGSRSSWLLQRTR